MRTMKTKLFVAALLATNVVTLLAFVVWRGPGEPSQALRDETDAARLDRIEASLVELRGFVATLPERGETLEGVPAAPERAGDVAARLDRLDTALARLQKSVDALASGAVAAAPSEPIDFTADDGYQRADQLFEGGRFASAAEGFLEFARTHPDHPDRRAFLDKARGALEKAGYGQRAIDLQKEIIEEYPDQRGNDFNTLARIYFDAKRYGEAIEAIGEAINLSTNRSEELGRRMYRAWYIELLNGPAAGLEAYREVDLLRQSYGVESEKMAAKIAERIAALERRVQSGT